MNYALASRQTLIILRLKKPQISCALKDDLRPYTSKTKNPKKPQRTLFRVLNLRDVCMHTLQSWPKPWKATSPIHLKVWFKTVRYMCSYKFRLGSHFFLVAGWIHNVFYSVVKVNEFYSAKFHRIKLILAWLAYGWDARYGHILILCYSWEWRAHNFINSTNPNYALNGILGVKRQYFSFKINKVIHFHSIHCFSSMGPSH